MEIIDKLRVLSGDSQYDLACACGRGKEDRRMRGSEGKWLYPVALPQGGYSVLLKTLLSNACTNDCKYCPLRSGTNVRRCSLKPEEVAKVFMEYYRRKKAFGLFLSSAVINNADYTMEKINSVARLLRGKYQYKGYIHLKILPGSSDAAIRDCMSLSTAVSLNIETPGRKHIEVLSTKKDYERDILRPLRLMGSLAGKGMPFSRVKCTTQFIVGASTETDSDIVESMYTLYTGLNFKRVYFSAYQKGLGEPDIPGERFILDHPERPFLREHRLYQVDFLSRKYGFRKEEIYFDHDGNLNLDKDPKEVWADNNRGFFPVRLNTSDKEALLRVPGIGPDTMQRIIAARRVRKITSLEGLGLRGKRLERIRKYIIFE